MEQKRFELQQKYLKLPEELKRAMFSVENAEHIQAIAQKYHLQTEKMQCLAKTAGLVLLGEIRLEDFEQEIQKQCGFIPESARDISQDVHQQIFSKIVGAGFKPAQEKKPVVGADFMSAQKDVKMTQEPDIKKELANHGIEIKEPKREDRYREAII